MFRPGLYQVPRTTFRHYPLLTLSCLAAMISIAVLVLGGPRHHVIRRAIPVPAAYQPGRGRTDTTPADDHRHKIEAILLTRSKADHYTVRDGDTLSDIAHKVYGHAKLWPALWWVNRHKISNPAALLAGTRLRLSDWHPEKAWLMRLAVAAIPKPPPQPVSSHNAGGGASTPPSAPPPAPTGESLQAYAQALFGGQYSCAAAIIERESGWSVTISNATSGAYGIPQALPGSKMASAGADWATNGETQLRWMKGYVDATYGGACAAWAHWQAAGSY